MIALSSQPALTVDVIAGGERSGGAYAVLDVTAPSGAALAPHAFAAAAAVVVLEGQVEIVLADDRRTLGPGEVTCLDPHTARRVTALTACRALVTAVPAGVEALGPLLEPPLPEADDLAALLAAAGVELLPRGWRADDR